MNSKADIGLTFARTCQLGDLLDFRSEIVHPKDKPTGSSIFVGLEHIERDTGVRVGAEHIDLSDLTGRRARFFSGDIVYGYLRPYLNKVWIAEFDGICSVDQYVFIVRPDVDRDYIARFLRSDHFLETAPIGSSPGQLPRIRTGEIAATPIVLPSLADQRRIAAILDAADNLRRIRRRALKLLDDLVQSLFMEMFGREISLMSDRSTKMLGEIVDLQNGAYYPADLYSSTQAGTEMVHMSDAFYGVVQRGSLRRVMATSADVQKYGLSQSDLIIARRSLNIEGAAKPCLIPFSGEPLLYESSFVRLRPRKGTIRSPYLYHYLSLPLVRARELARFITQSTISGINQSNLSKVRVFVPPVAAQEEFCRAVEMVDQNRQAHAKSLEVLGHLFSSLQARAFSGRL
ncbi:type I restriction enzyme S subunit [Bradyrhizobium sp. S3.12.5]|uniref:restriction endonuclease subunit S n=1 Tax=Bradyrhizobium sp. S3.12.5 TaxID=3156386 RepID=UPI0033929AD1